MGHSHVLADTDSTFQIDHISRKISNISSNKTTIIQHDHNSEKFTFRVERYIEGHDLLSCNRIEVHYVNTDAVTREQNAGVYTITDLHEPPEYDGIYDKYIECSWIIARTATKYVGQLQFLIRFSCVNEETGEIEYVWNTAPYGNILISAGIYNTYTPSDNPVPPFNFVMTVNSQMLKFFLGTTEEWLNMPLEIQETTYPLLTDEVSEIKLLEQRVEDIQRGNVSVGAARKLAVGSSEILTGKTVAEVRSALDAWLRDYNYLCGGQYTLHDLSNEFISFWNNEDTTTPIAEGPTWTVTLISTSWNNYDYCTLLLSCYDGGENYIVRKNNREWGGILKIMLAGTPEVSETKKLSSEGYYYIVFDAIGSFQYQLNVGLVYWCGKKISGNQNDFEWQIKEDGQVVLYNNKNGAMEDITNSFNVNIAKIG